MDDFRKWIQSNLVYPPEAKKNGISGQVYVGFKVTSSGKVSDIRIIRGVNPLLDKEAIRVVGSSPDWTPAVKDGKNTDVEIAINIDFSLDNKEFVYYFVEHQAQFQGGTLDDFRQWVQKNLTYPQIAKEKGIVGRVTVQFAVNSKGKVCDAVILRGVDPSLDEEVLRVMQLSPEWTPAENKGMKVAQQFVIPVIFSLEKKPGVTGESSYKYENYDASIVTEKAAQQIQDNQQGEPSFVYVEQQASFKGGDLEAFRDWVQNNLIYPSIAKEDGIFGRVVVQFAVNSQGKVVDVKVLRSVDPSLDNEAIRVVTSSPDWVPAQQSGRSVKQQFVIPVIFSFSDQGSVGKYPPMPPSGITSVLKFQGAQGNEAIEKFRGWVQSQIVYPKEAKSNGIQGEILFQFTIMPSGKMGDVKIVKGVHQLLDEELIRVVRSSPDWEPFPAGENKAIEIPMSFIFKIY
jgi:TonB family protein